MHWMRSIQADPVPASASKANRNQSKGGHRDSQERGETGNLGVTTYCDPLGRPSFAADVVVDALSKMGPAGLPVLERAS